MRILIAGLVLFWATVSPAAADYGEDLCKKYMPPETPCTCVAPILEAEFDAAELDPLMQFLRAFTKGLGGERAPAQETIDAIPRSTAKRPSWTG
jgi:hypothetical protein